MGVFKEMDPEVALAAIQGYQDELSSAYEAQEALYRNYKCPRCRCALQKEFHGPTAFDSDSVIAKALLRCENCHYLIDPRSNIILETGDASKIPFERVPDLGRK